MSPQEYLDALDARLRALAGVILASSMQREVDESLGTGFHKGRIVWVDGSILEFVEQLPVDRRKYRIHSMDARNQLIARWDSAPHHHELEGFPFHKHTASGVESHPATTLLQVLEQVVDQLKL